MRQICLFFLLVRATFAFKSLVALEDDSKALLSRQRRFLIPSTTGWSFTLRFTLKFPLEGLGTSMDLNVPFPYSFSLPSIGRKKRDVSSHFYDREVAIKTIEKYMPSIVSLPSGITSHDCMLRAICEVARTPANDDGLMGDMVNLLLTPSHVLDKLALESDYLDAQRTGHFFQNCAKYEANCPMSLFECIENDNLDAWPSSINSLSNHTALAFP